MEPLIIRNDDVNFNTSPRKLGEIYGVISSIFPDAEIWSVVSLFGGKNQKGSVYGDLPLKDKDVNWFYKNADCIASSIPPISLIPNHKIASHGLFHIDHSKVSRETQEMSILGSCSYLKTNIFVPPFNKFNKYTMIICFENKIDLYTDWKSMEFEPFDINHRRWYFHSWRWDADKLRGYFDEYVRNTKERPDMGQLQEPTVNGT